MSCKTGEILKTSEENGSNRIRKKEAWHGVNINKRYWNERR